MPAAPAVAPEATPSETQKSAAGSAAPAPDAPPKITIEGPDTAKAGDEIKVAVRLASGTAPGKLRAQVRFDASALQLLSAEPGSIAASGESPKLDIRPGGVQLELEGNSDTPLGANGSIVDLRFRAVTPRPNVLVSTQVVMLGEGNVAMAATPGTALKIAISQ
jgi:general secretion pathway protein D